MISSVGVERPDLSVEKTERMASESEEPASLDNCFCRSLSSSSKRSFEDIVPVLCIPVSVLEASEIESVGFRAVYLTLKKERYCVLQSKNDERFSIAFVRCADAMFLLGVIAAELLECGFDSIGGVGDGGKV